MVKISNYTNKVYHGGIETHSRERLPFFEKVSYHPKWGFILAGGRPSHGKTQYLLEYLLNKERSKQQSGLYYTLGTPVQLLMERMMKIVSRKNIHIAQLNMIDEEERTYTQLPTTVSQLQKLESHIVSDTAEIDKVDNYYQRLQNLVDKHQPSFVLIDDLDKIAYTIDPTPRHPPEQYNHALEKLTQQLFFLQREVGVPFLCTLTLTEIVEMRGGSKRPNSLSDLGLEAAEYYSDLIMALYRPILYGFTQNEEGTDLSKVIECIVLKNNEGPCISNAARFDESIPKMGDEFG